ncbi:hypothetical protein M405DRAFT_832221 [Rhizopogon salebrosus TDB-379]|nr:hypothetical protein M405DRAFT_832221 [Rhizopogon salebrosus TDB-379]
MSESGKVGRSVTPVFWAAPEDRAVVTPFTIDTEAAKTIYEFDSSTLETVGTPFEGHADLCQRSSASSTIASSSGPSSLASSSLHSIKVLPTSLSSHQTHANR